MVVRLVDAQPFYYAGSFVVIAHSGLAALRLGLRTTSAPVPPYLVCRSQYTNGCALIIFIQV